MTVLTIDHLMARDIALSTSLAAVDAEGVAVGVIRECHGIKIIIGLVAKQKAENSIDHNFTKALSNI